MKKDGLILEGGGMRGIFTAGVLDAFMDNNIYFHNCIGVSAGACHMTSYISNQKGRAYKVCIDYLKDKRYCSLYSLIKTGDLFGVDFIYNEIPNHLNLIDKIAFKNNNTIFETVLTNIDTGESEYFEVKDLDTDTIYINASSSLPVVSRPVKINNKEYLDGAISDSVPIKYYLNKNIKKIVVVLTRPRGYRKKQNKYTQFLKLVYNNKKNLIDAIKNRYIIYNQTMDLIERLEDEGKIFVIRPPRDLGIKRVEKNISKLNDAYKLGYDTTIAQIEYLKKYLKIGY